MFGPSNVPEPTSPGVVMSPPGLEKDSPPASPGESLFSEASTLPEEIYLPQIAPPDTSASGEFVWPPKRELNPDQERAVLASLNPELQTMFFVGGVGSGKSTVAFDIFMDWVTRTPGGLFLIGRKNYRELDDITIPKVLEWLGPMLAEYVPGDDRYALVRTRDPKRHAKIIFRFLEETGQLGSMELGGFWIEEAHELSSSKALKDLLGRLRGHGPQKGILTFNPPSYRHWLYEEGVLNQKPNSTIIRFSTHNNKKVLDRIAPGYIKNLESSLDYEDRKAMLDGFFRFVDGDGVPAYKRFFFPRIHVKPFEFNPKLPLLVGLDFGYNVGAGIIGQGSPDQWFHAGREVRVHQATTHELLGAVFDTIDKEFPGAYEIYHCDPAGIGKQSGSGESDIAVVRAALKQRGVASGLKFRKTRPKERMRLIQYLCLNRQFKIDENVRTLRDGFLGGLRVNPDNDEIIKDGFFDHPHDALGYILIHVFKYTLDMKRRVMGMLRNPTFLPPEVEPSKLRASLDGPAWAREQNVPAWCTLEEADAELKRQGKLNPDLNRRRFHWQSELREV